MQNCKEENLNKDYKQLLEPWFQTGVSEYLAVDENIKLYTWAMIHKQEKAAIVFLNGRAEYVERYKETLYDLWKQGYSLYSLDHRGQGRSSRLQEDKELGHIESFDEYVDDMHILMEKKVLPAKHKHVYIIAHSMGACIAMLYMEKYPNNIQAAALCAPLIFPRYSKSHPQIMKYVVKFILIMKKILGGRFQYVRGRGPWKNSPFQKDCDYCQSEVRWNISNEQLKNNSVLRLGGPSWQWLIAAEKAGKYLLKNAHKISTPILILQASDERIVDNKSQNKFCEKVKSNGNKNCTLQRLEQARHELFNEKDEIRSQVLLMIEKFFAGNS